STSFAKDDVRPGGSGTVAFEIGFQHEGAVVQFVARGVDESGGPASALLPRFVDHVLVLPEFRTVALLEFAPAGRIVIEPPAQLGAGGQVLDVEVHGG